MVPAAKVRGFAAGTPASGTMRGPIPQAVGGATATPPPCSALSPRPTAGPARPARARPPPGGGARGGAGGGGGGGGAGPGQDRGGGGGGRAPAPVRGCRSLAGKPPLRLGPRLDQVLAPGQRLGLGAGPGAELGTPGPG